MECSKYERPKTHPGVFFRVQKSIFLTTDQSICVIISISDIYYTKLNANFYKEYKTT